MRYAVLVCGKHMLRPKLALLAQTTLAGPAGAGKSTLCTSLITHLQTVKRTGHLLNLDPAATNESFEVEPSIDIRNLISLEDVMTEFGYGPNGGLIYCFE